MQDILFGTACTPSPPPPYVFASRIHALTCPMIPAAVHVAPRHRPSHCHNISLGTPIYPCEPVDGCVAGCNGGLGLDALRHVPAGAAARRS